MTPTDKKFIRYTAAAISVYCVIFAAITAYIDAEYFNGPRTLMFALMNYFIFIAISGTIYGLTHKG